MKKKIYERTCIEASRGASIPPSAKGMQIVTQEKPFITGSLISVNTGV